MEKSKVAQEKSDLVRALAESEREHQEAVAAPWLVKNPDSQKSSLFSAGFKALALNRVVGQLKVAKGNEKYDPISVNVHNPDIVSPEMIEIFEPKKAWGQLRLTEGPFRPSVDSSPSANPSPPQYH